MATDPTPKSYLVGRVRETLAQDPRVNDLNVNVTITGEKVYLSGIVATTERREAISEVMADAFPDLVCVNEIKVGNYPETHETEQLS